ncbi:MAG: hypothetical protein KDA63_02035, partial [Planctomycetales bacterium]|nr:hypothetical protein [Planctomycetales bacterium]
VFPTSLSEAMTVAAGLANPGRSDPDDPSLADALPAHVYLFSDGHFSDVTDFSLGNLSVDFRRIGTNDAANVGIVAFATQRNEDRDGELVAYGRVQNFSPDAAEVEIQLLLDGELVDAEQVEIAAGDTHAASFELAGDIEEGVLELRVGSQDSLELDDRAWVAVNPRRRARVLVVTPGNEPLELGLTTEIAARLADVRFEGPDFLKTDTYRNPAQSGYYDLVIYDRCSPEAMPQANTLMIAALPPGDAWSAEASVDVPQIIDIERSHPLLQLIEMVEVRIVEATPLVAPSGATSLIDTDRAGVVFAIAPREAFEDAVLGFSLVTAEGLNTDWPMKLSFPLFLFNVIEYLGGVRDPLVAGTVAPGSSVKLETEGAGEELEVQKPDDARVTVLRSDFGTYHFAETDELGVYAVSAGDEKKLPQHFAVNLFDPQESNIRLPETNQITIGNVDIAGSAAEQVARHQGWKILVLLALVVLLVEWYIYNRRVYL